MTFCQVGHGGKKLYGGVLLPKFPIKKIVISYDACVGYKVWVLVLIDLPALSTFP
jgi:hypothetical protein